MSNRRRLAIEGGEPTFPDGPPQWPSKGANTSDRVREAVETSLASGTWGLYAGPNTDRLVQTIAAHHQLEHVRLCCSGTIGVELALRGLGVGPGDEVILAGYDFPGNFRAIEAAGAFPVIVDMLPETFQIDANEVEAAIGPQTKAVVASHLHGELIDAQSVREIADRRGIHFVEDVCQVPGASIGGQTVGAFGHACVHSFGGSKLLSAGRGGAVVTSDEQLAQRMTVFAERGNDAFALSELQATVLLPQWDQLEDNNETRLNAARLLQGELSDCLIRPAEIVERPSYYKLGLHLSEEARLDPDQVSAALVAEGVAIYRGFRGFASRSKRRCRRVGELKQCRKLADEALILHHPILLSHQDDLRCLAQVLREVADLYS